MIRKTLRIALISLFLASAAPAKPVYSQGGKGAEMTEMNDANAIGEGTPIIMTMNGTEVRAVLNNTLTAREFAERLSYSVTLSRAVGDLCGSVSEKLPSDPSEGREGWR